MLENLLFIAKVVLPVFLLVIVGVFLKLLKIIDEPFINTTSIFVYRVALPVLIFMKLYDVDINQAFDPAMIIMVIMGTVFTYLIAYVIAKTFKMNPQNEGVFIQGAFRSNYAIVGLAIVIRMYGPEALAKASFLLLFVLPMYNLLSIFALIHSSASQQVTVRKTFKEVITNPLIIAVCIAILYSFLGIGLDSTLVTTGNYIAQTALPLALIGIGGGFNIDSIKSASKPAFASSFLKIVISPFIAVIFAYFVGVSGMEMGILFIIFSCPTAIASYVLAAGLKGNIKLAGNIIIISTLGSIGTIIIGLFLLTWIGLI
jgi:hypothetical protein